MLGISHPPTACWCFWCCSPLWLSLWKSRGEKSSSKTPQRTADVIDGRLYSAGGADEVVCKATWRCISNYITSPPQYEVFQLKALRSAPAPGLHMSVSLSCLNDCCPGTAVVPVVTNNSMNKWLTLQHKTLLNHWTIYNKNPCELSQLCAGFK